jgi:5-methylcytosine-specific restriction endonuclease McrA
MPTSRNTTIRDRHRASIAKTKPPCGICGEPIDYTLPHTDLACFVVDHIIPYALSKDDTISNKQPAHNACNAAKSDTVPEGMEAPPRTFVTTLTW